MRSSPGRPLLAVSALLAFVAPLAAQQANAAAVVDLGPMLASLRETHRVPALGAAVIVDGALAALGVDGVRKQGSPAKVTVDDRWHLGSCTKAMTATLLALQVEAGELAWTTTVEKGLPDLAATMHADAKAITVRDLLQHRAGLPGGPPDELWARLFEWKGTDVEARTAVAAALLAKAPQSKPGEGFLYSNAGYMVAGSIAERLGKKPWAELMQEKVFAPLGITSGGFGTPGSEKTTDQPWGHHPGEKGPTPDFGDNPPSLGPAGTAHMTLRDWAKFAALHLGVPAANGKLLLKPETLAALHEKPAKGDYALGWGVLKRGWAPGPILTHSGSNTVWFCVAWLAPEAKFGVLVTCNQGDTGDVCDAVAAACIGRFAPKKK